MDNTAQISASGPAGRPQGIAPTVVTVMLGRPIRTIVGAIPCGRPGEPEALISLVLTTRDCPYNGRRIGQQSVFVPFVGAIPKQSAFTTMTVYDL